MLVVFLGFFLLCFVFVFLATFDNLVELNGLTTDLVIMKTGIILIFEKRFMGYLGLNSLCENSGK